MKIGIDARFYGTPGKGLGRYTEKLIRELEHLSDTHEYHIFLSPEGYRLYQPRNNQFHKHQVPYSWYGVSEQLFYPWRLLIENLDLMHFPHFNVPLLYRRPFVVTVHDLILFHFPTHRASTRSALWYWFKYWGYKRVIQSALRRARKVITVSEFTRRDLASVYPAVAAKLSVTLEGVEAFCHWSEPREHRKTLARWLIGQETPFLLYVGNAYPHKNLDLLLDIAEALPDLKMVLVGKHDYFYDALKKKANARKLANVLFVGGVNDQELADLYREATLYLFPSLYEGFGLPPLEAMAYGTPVVASNRGSLPEILGAAAHLVEPDRESFLSAIRELLEDPDKRTALTQAGFRKIEEYSWKTMARDTEALYSRIGKAA